MSLKNIRSYLREHGTISETSFEMILGSGPEGMLDEVLEPSNKVLKAAKELGIPALSNSNIKPALDKAGVSVDDLLPGVTVAFEKVLEALAIDFKEDHNSKETAKRYAKMVLLETFKGRYTGAPRITEFPNASNVDQLIVQKNLRVESTCSHHHQNIRGVAHIGVLPHAKGQVIGLSKYSRIVDFYSRRPQIQEELTANIANHINTILKPRGVIVVIESEHQCMTVRGVREPNALTTTSFLLGEMLNSPDLRSEFYTLLGKR
jgi:GTP cyclohydrolase I